MRINSGSKNKIKIDALKEILFDYPYFKNAEIEAVEAPSGVDNQPKSLEETISGAMNRAKKAFANCDYSFGLESGLMGDHELIFFVQKSHAEFFKMKRVG